VAKAQRCRFTAEYKLAIVEEAERATGPDEIGSLLRREGLYSSHLVQWRRLRAVGALSALFKKRGRKPTGNPLAEERQKLRAQVARLEKKLQQAEIIIDVRKSIGPAGDRAAGNGPGRVQFMTAALALSPSVGRAATCRALEISRASFYRALAPRAEPTAAPERPIPA
jgi:transposase-like protein